MPTKKLIEVALPLDDINAASAREKSIRHGHPSTLHLWWARRPLAACRAVLFASLIDDPDQEGVPEKLLAEIDRLPAPELPDWRELPIGEQRRQRLFRFIKTLVQWESSNDERVLATARRLIHAATGGNPPPVYDPFAGGGSIPLEAQRLGLEAHASDLNPVAVLINKALIEIPPKFAGMPPVNPESRNENGATRNERGTPVSEAGGLAEGDGSRADHLYPDPAPSARGNVRDALAADARYRVDSGEYRGGLDARVPQREGSVPGDRPGVAGGSGDPADIVRADRLVPNTSDRDGPTPDGRGQPHSDDAATQDEGGARNAELGTRSEGRGAQSSFLPARSWPGAAGLAADVRYYGKWMRDEAERRIGHLYPKVKLPKEYGGGEATVIAWLWARTVTCPNPACGATMPLVRSFALSTKKGKETWVEPVVVRNEGGGMRNESGGVRNEDGHSTSHSSLLSPRSSVRFEVRSGAGRPPEGTVGRKGARCVCCGTSVPLDHVRAEGKAGRMGAQMMAIVAEGKRGRIYLPPDEEHERIAASAQPEWAPETELPEQALGFRVQNYGLTHHRDLFTPRQLVALTTFIDLVGEARERVRRAAEDAGERDAEAYANAVATYLAFAADRLAESCNTLSRWQSTGDKVAGAFSRQTLSMLWDYADVNAFSSSTRNFYDAIEWVAEALEGVQGIGIGVVSQHNAEEVSPTHDKLCKLISTDPPYYDNVPYADLSDFFYVWLRAALRGVYPELFGTMLVPKTQELVAEPFRHGGREAAQQFFEQGLFRVFERIRAAHNADYPLTVYYAFKQTESDDAEGTSKEQRGKSSADATQLDSAEDSRSSFLPSLSSTGWETMLEGLLRAGFTINGTWPMRTEREARTRSLDSNALATSIVLVCRPRPEDARSTTRLEFVRMLRRELPAALRALQHANIAPVDLAQAAIGPGMAIYSRYRAVLEADGTPMRVRTALQLINQALDEVLAEQEGEYDADTRWAIAWFEQHAFEEGQYGVAETLSKAKNTSVQGMVDAGIITARAGKVRLLRRDELPAQWSPADDTRITAWEATQYLVRALDKEGESGAAAVLGALPGGLADTARDLAYRLYTTCERKKWAQEALAYNALVIAWPEIARLATERQSAAAGPVQGSLFG